MWDSEACLELSRKSTMQKQFSQKVIPYIIDWILNTCLGLARVVLKLGDTKQILQTLAKHKLS